MGSIVFKVTDENEITQLIVKDLMLHSADTNEKLNCNVSKEINSNIEELKQTGQFFQEAKHLLLSLQILTKIIQKDTLFILITFLKNNLLITKKETE